MRVNGSKPGEINHIVPFSNGALRSPHVKLIGPAFPLFLLFEDKVTAGEGTDGLVLRGRPVTDEQLAKALGVHPKTAAAHRIRLEEHGYIKTLRTGRGYIVRVRKSKKWLWLEGLRKSHTAPSDRAKPLRQIERKDSIRESQTTPSRSDISGTNQGQGSEHARKQHADSRFQPVTDSYFEGYRKTMGEEADFDKADGVALKRLLSKHQDLTVEEIGRRLQNAFTSTADWPLSRAFRFTEFARHHAKFKDGPKHRRNGAGGNGNQPVQIPEPNKLSKEDERVYEQYRGSSQ